MEKTNVETDIIGTEQDIGSISEEEMRDILHDDWIIGEALRRMRQELKERGII